MLFTKDKPTDYIAKLDRLMAGKHTSERIFGGIVSCGNKTMFKVPDGHGWRDLSFAGFEGVCKLVACTLGAKLPDGTKYILIKGVNSEFWYAAFWGSLMGGFTPVLISAFTKSYEIQDIKDELNGKSILLLTDKNALPKEEEGVFSLFGLLAGSSASMDVIDCFGDELALVSSGSEGKPKIVFYDGEALCNQLNSARNLIAGSDCILSKENGKRAVILSLLPMHHVFGFVASTLWYAFFGQTIVFPEELTYSAYKRACIECGVSHVFAVPTFFDMVARDLDRCAGELRDGKKAMVERVMGYNNSSVCKKANKKTIIERIKDNLLGRDISYCISGGGFIGTATLKALNGIGYPLRNGYGSTELGVLSVEGSDAACERIKGSIGDAFFGAEYKLSDGELLVKSVTKGKCSEAQIDDDGFVHTGDLARLEGGKYYLVGRKSRVIINSDGENIYPEKIEAYLKSKLSVPYSVQGKDIDGRVAIVLVAEGLEAKDKLISILKEVNVEAHPLRRIERLILTEKLPRTPGGKVDLAKTKALAESLEGEKLTGESGQIAETEIGKEAAIIREIFAKELDISEGDIYGDSDFFTDLGGSSLAFMEAVVKVSTEFGVEIKGEEYKHCYTVSGVAKLVREKKS